MSFRESIEKALVPLNSRFSELQDEFSKHGAERLNESIFYSLLNGGKRLRAYMVYEFTRLASGNTDSSTDYAVALEMIHAFSLIHDDLPAMDNDDMRRGKPSNHKAFGEATAILAGDSLALDAFILTASNKKCTAEQNMKATALLAKKAGSFGMCAGQQIDLDGEGKKLGIEALTKLVDHKTGALFEASCMLGVIASNGSEEQLKAAESFGLLTGRAFQITDDLLDIYSTPEELGKTVGKDIISEKSTFVSLLGEAGARAYAEECISEAKRQLEFFADGEAKDNLNEFCDYILIRKK